MANSDVDDSIFYKGRFRVGDYVHVVDQPGATGRVESFSWWADEENLVPAILMELAAAQEPPKVE